MWCCFDEPDLIAEFIARVFAAQDIGRLFRSLMLEEVYGRL